MVNIYAYTYPSAIKEDHILVKIGETIRDDVGKRINEQGGAAEFEEKIILGVWHHLKSISSDRDLHRILKSRGLYHHGNHRGTEWFIIPASSIEEAQTYINELIEELEGYSVSNYTLEKNQARASRRSWFIMAGVAIIFIALHNVWLAVGIAMLLLMIVGAVVWVRENSDYIIEIIVRIIAGVLTVAIFSALIYVILLLDRIQSS